MHALLRLFHRSLNSLVSSLFGAALAPCLDSHSLVLFLCCSSLSPLFRFGLVASCMSCSRRAVNSWYGADMCACRVDDAVRPVYILFRMPPSGLSMPSVYSSFHSLATAPCVASSFHRLCASCWHALLMVSPVDLSTMAPLYSTPKRNCVVGTCSCAFHRWGLLSSSWLPPSSFSFSGVGGRVFLRAVAAASGQWFCPTMHGAGVISGCLSLGLWVPSSFSWWLSIPTV